MNSTEEAAALYDKFLERLQRERTDVAAWIERAVPFGLELGEQLARLDELKAWLDAFRPLPREVVEELRHFYAVRLTFHSNALQGNTLSQRETELVLSHGITIGGHSLVEHLEVIGHRDAMVYLEKLARDQTPIGAREVKDLHALIVRPSESATGQNEAGRFRSLDVRGGHQPALSAASSRSGTDGRVHFVAPERRSERTSSHGFCGRSTFSIRFIRSAMATGARRAC